LHKSYGEQGCSPTRQWLKHLTIALDLGLTFSYIQWWIWQQFSIKRHVQFCHSVQIFTDISYKKKIKNGKFQPKIPPLLSVVFHFFLISKRWQIIAGKINYTGKTSFSPSQVFLKNKSHKIVNHHTQKKFTGLLFGL
jgi:hypothetical protein